MKRAAYSFAVWLLLVTGCCAVGVCTLGFCGVSSAQAQTRSQRLKKAKSLFEEGRDSYAQGQLRGALRRFLQAHRLAPSAELAYNIGHICEQLGDAANAVRFLRLYLSRSRGQLTDRSQVEERLTRLERERRRYHELIVTWAPRLAREARPFFWHGVRMFQMGRYGEAVEHFRAARRLSAAPEVNYNLALTYERLGRRAEAIRYYSAYLEAEPKALDRELIEDKVLRLRRRMRSGQ